MFFFFKQKTAYEMRISDWSSDVCSSDLRRSSRPLSAATDGTAASRPARNDGTPILFPVQAQAPEADRLCQSGPKSYRPCFGQLGIWPSPDLRSRHPYLLPRGYPPNSAPRGQPPYPTLALCAHHLAIDTQTPGPP